MNRIILIGTIIDSGLCFLQIFTIMKSQPTWHRIPQNVSWRHIRASTENMTSVPIMCIRRSLKEVSGHGYAFGGIHSCIIGGIHSWLIIGWSIWLQHSSICSWYQCGYLPSIIFDSLLSDILFEYLIHHMKIRNIMILYKLSVKKKYCCNNVQEKNFLVRTYKC